MLMNDAAAAAYLNTVLFAPPKPQFVFKMPRVVTDQKAKFESDALFQQLSRDGEVRFTANRDRPQNERQIHFQNECNLGRTQLAFYATGTNLQLVLKTPTDPHEEPDFDYEKQPGKVHLKSRWIMNGVCVRFRGWLDMTELRGLGRLEFDVERAAEEHAIMIKHVQEFDVWRKTSQCGTKVGAAGMWCP